MTKKLSKTHIDSEAIRAVNVRVNNLKNVNLTLDRNRFVVITGVSGSGKSSLAFDTLYAEGRRRYVESLSAYARQFMGKMAKPECDMIKGLPPAIAIEQKVNTRNPRSTVGTATEIYDYLRLLFGRVGRTISPVSSTEVKKHSVADVTARALEYGEGTRVAIAAPIILPEGREFASQLNVLLKGGYSRLVDSSNRFIPITDLLDKAEAGEPLPDPSELLLLIDRLAVATEGDELSRMADSAETAFFEGRGECVLIVWTGEGATVRHIFSNRFEADGMTFREPSDQMFNFNNPYGACPRCEGLGRTVGIDEQLVVPDPTKSIYDDAVVCWRGEKMSEWKQRLILMADRLGFPIHRPYASLTPAEKDILWHGKGSWEGIDGFFRMVEENQYKIQYRVMLSRYRGKTTCPDCHGSRLAPDALYVEVGGMTIDRIVNMPVSRLIEFFNNLSLSGNDLKIAKRLLDEIKSRLTFLVEVGLGYLTLNRLSSTLSGGESQRINLATSLGSSLVGSLYILDEPSIGLHSRDTDRLIKVLRRLQSIGNTVVVVEHDEDIMRAADEIVDVGPLAGRLGGEIVYTGPVVPSADVAAPSNQSLTLRYLDGSLSIPVPKSRRKWRDYIQVEGARQHNLKDLTVKFPLGVMTVVTGVSGSGKSTLVRDILYRALVRHLGEAGDAPGAFTRLSGSLSMIKGVEFIDQNPIGRSSRSNPATYLKAFDEVRKLFADQQGAKQMGFSPGYFSFNAEGGRCEECKGEGTITIEMQFMADITITCNACHGKRYKRNVLDIEYRGKNIYDVLNMSVDEAIEFFGQDSDATARRIASRLQPLSDVGLGYIKLGQSSSTLSGGENQRVKLAYYLAQESTQPTMFIFDEPTTGLHFHDTATLLDAFNRLIAKGHTIVIIEHNIDVIKTADHVIDIGPEGGDAGGQVVCEGTPEQIAACHASYTGRHLAPKLISGT